MNAVLVPPLEQIQIRTFPFLIMDVFHLPPRGRGCREATGKNGATGRVPSAGSAHNLIRLHVLDLVHWLKSPQSAATLSPPNSFCRSSVSHAAETLPLRWHLDSVVAPIGCFATEIDSAARQQSAEKRLDVSVEPAQMF